MFGKSKRPGKNDPVVVQRYNESGKKEVATLDSPKDARKFLNRIAKQHGKTPGVVVKPTPNGLTVEGADGKPVTHYNIEKE